MNAAIEIIRPIAPVLGVTGKRFDDSTRLHFLSFSKLSCLPVLSSSHGSCIFIKQVSPILPSLFSMICINGLVEKLAGWF